MIDVPELVGGGHTFLPTVQRKSHGNRAVVEVVAVAVDAATSASGHGLVADLPAQPLVLTRLHQGVDGEKREQCQECAQYEYRDDGCEI